MAEFLFGKKPHSRKLKNFQMANSKFNDPVDHEQLYQESQTRFETVSEFLCP